ncbi:sugar transferase [Lactobacillus delbrueckii]|uniref:sugar transferase n=1 Tax=Lactobacillus delbrueckii TaxID=1584 RepID=UPI0039C46ABD
MESNLEEVKTQGTFYKTSKRIFDVLGSFLALVCLSPVFLILSIIIKKHDGGKVFFKQKRVGKNGKEFFMYKFRSMEENAEEILKADKGLYAKYIANGFKLPAEEDPRITSIGKWLRRTSFDELPQFINILRGEMSIVGPRPIVPTELEEYGDRKAKLLSVKPGAMGLWQATGRSNITYPERCDVELEYVDNASLGYDWKIFFLNLISIFKQDGAF